MNTTQAVVVSTLIASSAAVAVSLTLRPRGEADVAVQLAAVESAQSELRAANEALTKRLDALITNPIGQAAPATLTRTEAAVVRPEQVAAAVEAYLRRRGDASATPDAGDVVAFDLERDLEHLLEVDYWSDSAAWRRAFDAGRMDDVIAEMERRAAANPNDVDTRMSLANAYLAYLQMDNTKWPLSMKADEQFDEVLAIDEGHWDARFSKAMSYTFWPDFLGKKSEAIQHFERLVEQQTTMPAEPQHAQTYLFLGNLLLERDPTRAREVWQQGLQRHPGNTALLEKLGG